MLAVRRPAPPTQLLGVGGLKIDTRNCPPTKRDDGGVEEGGGVSCNPPYPRCWPSEQINRRQLLNKHRPSLPIQWKLTLQRGQNTRNKLLTLLGSPQPAYNKGFTQRQDHLFSAFSKIPLKFKFHIIFLHIIMNKVDNLHSRILLFFKRLPPRNTPTKIYNGLKT